MGWWQNRWSGDDRVRNLRVLQQLASGRKDARPPPAAGRHTPEPPPPLDLCLVTHNNGHWTDRFLKSLLGQSYPTAAIGITVVDSGSSDDTADRWDTAARQHASAFRRFEVLRQSNRGFGAGHNLAASRGDADWLLISNVDLEFERDAIHRAVAHAARDTKQVASFELRQKPYEHPRYYDPVTFETACSSHACVLLRRDAFARVGGYDERIFLYGEDIELSFRLRRAGYRLRVCPSAVVWHYCYDQAHAFRPQQYFGSALGRCFNRLRYDTLWNLPAVLTVCRRMRAESRAVPDGEARFRGAMQQLIRNAPHFLFSRRRSPVAFPFRIGHYERRREGAFYEHRQQPEGTPAPPDLHAVIRVEQSEPVWLRETLLTVLNQVHRPLRITLIHNREQPWVRSVQEQTASLPSQAVEAHSGDEAAVLRQVIADVAVPYVLTMSDTALLFADHIEVCMRALEDEPSADAATGRAWFCRARAAHSGTHTEELSYDTKSEPRRSECIVQRIRAAQRPNHEKAITTVEKTTAILRQPA